MTANPYLNFNGRCAEAFKFYEQALGGQVIAMMTFGETPMADHVPAVQHGLIIHACMQVGDTVIMASDSTPDRFKEPQGFSVSLHLESAAEAERIFSALAENGTVQMPIQETFWAARFGMLTDQFGIPWMLNCDQPAAA